MTGFRGLLLSLGFAAIASPALAQSRPEDPPCYDMAVVGRIIDASNFVGLDRLSPPSEDPNRIWLGGRSDFRIKVEVASSTGRLPPGIMTVQAVMTSLPVRKAAILFFVRHLEDGRNFAVDWTWASPDWLGRYRAVAHDTLQRCAKSAAPGA